MGQRVWVRFTTVFAHRGAMYSCIGCALNKSVMSKGYVYIIGVVNWYIYHYLCLEDTKSVLFRQNYYIMTILKQMEVKHMGNVEQTVAGHCRN